MVAFLVFEFSFYNVFAAVRPAKPSSSQPNTFFTVFLSRPIEILLPICAPMNTITARGIVAFHCHVPLIRCPMKPPVAVIPTMNELDATAISMGTPSSRTMAATFKMPPPTPTIPLTKPATTETGIAIRRFMQYGSLFVTRRHDIGPRRQPFRLGLLSIFSIIGKAAMVTAPARIHKRTSSLRRFENMLGIIAIRHTQNKLL